MPEREPEVDEADESEKPAPHKRAARRAGSPTRAAAVVRKPAKPRDAEEVEVDSEVHFVFARRREDTSGLDLVHRVAKVVKVTDRDKGIVTLRWRPSKPDRIQAAHGGELEVTNVRFDPEPLQGTWHWPSRACDE